LQARIEATEAPSRVAGVISDLVADRVVEGVFAVKSKRRLRTKGGTAYLALELVDPTGHIDARVWSDVELLDGRFGEGDAIRVLGRVEKFRDRLQLEVRTLEATDVDPVTLTPAMRRDTAELQGFLDFLVEEISHPGLAATVRSVLADRDLAAFPATPEDHHSYAGGLLEHTVGVATLCRETAQLHPRLRAELLLTAAILHDAGRTIELSRGPTFTPTEEGRLLGHVHLGVRLVDARAEGLSDTQKAELLHCVAAHHDARALRTAEAAVLYHANQLDASAANRPTG
jgi:3'-5' exoribonuclease